MTTRKKKPAKKAALRKSRIPTLQERATFALESIAESLLKLSTPLVSIDPKALTAPAAATVAAVDAVTEVAAVVQASVSAASEPTDSELLS